MASLEGKFQDGQRRERSVAVPGGFQGMNHPHLARGVLYPAAPQGKQAPEVKVVLPQRNVTVEKGYGLFQGGELSE
jgi:hypothetical protein